MCRGGDSRSAARTPCAARSAISARSFGSRARASSSRSSASGARSSRPCQRLLDQPAAINAAGASGRRRREPGARDLGAISPWPRRHAEPSVERARSSAGRRQGVAPLERRRRSKVRGALARAVAILVGRSAPLDDHVVQPVHDVGDEARRRVSVLVARGRASSLRTVLRSPRACAQIGESSSRPRCRRRRRVTVGAARCVSWPCARSFHAVERRAPCCSSCSGWRPGSSAIVGEASALNCAARQRVDELDLAALRARVGCRPCLARAGLGDAAADASAAARAGAGSPPPRRRRHRRPGSSC